MRQWRGGPARCVRKRSVLSGAHPGGFADFIGGFEARRLTVLTVLLFSQPVGLAAAAIWALSAGGLRLPLIDVAVAVGAGAAGAELPAALALPQHAGPVAQDATPGAGLWDAPMRDSSRGPGGRSPLPTDAGDHIRTL